MRVILAVVFLAFSLACGAQNYALYTKVVPSLTVEGKRIERGMTHDDFIARVGFAPLSTTTEPDAMLPGSLHVFKRFWQDKQQFLVEFKRETMQGPYVVYRIRLPST